MKQIFILITLVLSLSAHAIVIGGHDGNGGDPNEIKFIDIANNISEWITSGNANGVQLPENLTLAEYKQGMLAVLNSYNVQFTSDKVMVDEVEKTCKNQKIGGKNQIWCNDSKFAEAYAGNLDGIYQLVHHEFAGLAGLEISHGAKSNYLISSQISHFLENQLVRRLPVHRPLPNKSSTDVNIVASCDFEAMKPSLEGRFKDIIDLAMQKLRIDYDPTSIKIDYFGKNKFEIGYGSYVENLVAVSVRTNKGNVIQLRGGGLPEFGVSEPILLEERDGEGYVIKQECIITPSEKWQYARELRFFNETLNVALIYGFEFGRASALVK